jgi:hypothetical protein
MKCMSCGKECCIVIFDINGQCPRCLGAPSYCPSCKDRQCEKEETNELVGIAADDTIDEQED